ncbi:dienelactone hydrolase family protein [Halobacteria archaeon AArc-dxtr1]|nr:dienelactone hydrolase family protein [Halobacteria archaeon AArc-dxtr1]
MTDDPHQGQPVERAGAALEDAAAAVVLVHGRGAQARGMLSFADDIGRGDVAYLAPQAHRRTWYPQSFLAPTEANQPFLDSALSRLETVLETVADGGIPPERTVLLGFSQGACLSTEFAARNPRRYGGVVALSGGLIGDTLDPDRYDGSLEETPVFFGCSDRDPHIPEERVHDSAKICEGLEGDVETRIYEGMGHTVNQDEMDFVRELVASVAEA